MSSVAKKHDVFVSFRGEDTRSNFTSHLREALSQDSIDTFIDDKLPRGQNVWEAIAAAIEASRVSIVVFSEKYATSRWCLDELVKILECRRMRNQIVIPVFYQVDPSDVRHQRGSYDIVFAKHELDAAANSTQSNEQRVFKWKDALAEAANISGWHSKKDKDESLVIKDIVGDVSQKLCLRDPIEQKGHVGNEQNSNNVESLLYTHRVIGIWGMGGIGKSTIAKVLFAKLFHKFDHVCLVDNAKEYWLHKLFSALSKEKVSPANVDIVRLTSHMRKLSSKKIFIVLDDVNIDSSEPFEYLYKEYDVQHYQSRLIVTTRDKHLLEGRVDCIYKVEEWQNPKSLELFCLEAFNRSSPKEGYEGLSDRAVKYAGGVPLALKVLGSHFRTITSTEFWESTLRVLYNYPDQKIQKVLEMSYTGLHPLERNIFRDIAFFFKENEIDHVIRILDACGYEATSRIKVLADKALLTISKSSIIQMHDLLQQMGLEIVRLEDEDDPGKRSRLKDNEAREVIEENKGTGAIQGIALDLSQLKDSSLSLHADTFTKMKALRILKFYNTLGQISSNTYLNLPATLGRFSDKLRYIEWIGYPFESLPSPFCAKFLVEIHMPRSKVKQLWRGMQELDNLEVIDLSECQQFEELPDLSKAPRLKWVNLSCCESLRYLDPSALSSDMLVTLILDGCTKLESVTGEKHLKSLEKISVNGCSSLKEFAVSSDLIEDLDLSNTGIQTLGPQIGRMHNLKKLNLEGLRLKHLLEELSWLKSLTELKLCDTWQVIDEEQLSVLFNGLSSLLKLHMKDMRNLFELPYSINFLSKLQELRLDGSNVQRLPDSILLLEMLEILSLENCKELLCLPWLPSRIQYVGAINCTSLESVSSLNSLVKVMLGTTKFITFKNSLKLDEHSWEHIMESLQLTMMHAAIDNVINRHRYEHGYNYNSVVLCLPGSRVPWQNKYGTTNSSITIELPKYRYSLGLVYWVVLSPAGGTKKHGAKIKCICHLPEGTMSEEWLLSGYIGGLNSDHVYVFYDAYHCDNFLRYKQKVRFEFRVANDKGEVDGSICIKECGIRLIGVSDLPNVLEELDLEKGVELETGQRRTFTSMEEPSDEEESKPSDSILGTKSNSNSKMVQPDSAEEGAKSNSEMVEAYSAEEVEDNNGRKDYFYDELEESTGYTHEEIKIGAGSRESITEHTEDVKNKGNKRMPVEHDASLHDFIIESQLKTEYYESEDKSITQSKLVVMVELESAKDNNGSKDDFSGVEESIESACKATMTTARRGPEEKSTKSTKVLSKGNDGMLVESNARLYEPVESQPHKENASEDNSKPKLMIVEGESSKDDANEDHFFDVSKRSMHKETKTNARRDHKENTTESTEIIIEDTFALEVVFEREDDTAEGGAQISQSKTVNVDNEILSEPAAEKRPNVEAENQKQPIIELEDKELSSSSEEPKDPGQKELSDATSAADNLPEKPLQGDPDQELSSSTSVKTKSNHPNSPTPEYTPMNLDDCLNQVEENPFILLDFRSRELSISSKRSESSDQISSTKENFEAALEELRELAFSQSMTKNVKDVEYREKLEAAAQKLENFPQELNEELNGKIKAFFDLYNQTCEIVKEQEVTSDTITQVISEKDAGFDKLQTAKNQVKQLEDAIGECKPKIEELEKRENDLNDKIRTLQEELSGVEKDKAKLETAQGKNIAKKTDFVASARHVSTNLGRLLKQKEELEKSQAKLDIGFEALEKRYNKMRGEPHF